MKMLSGFLLIVCLMTPFSCGENAKKQSQSKIDSNMSSESELERNRKLWRESKIENYRMTIEINKTGHAAPNGKFVLTVRNGQTESLRPADDSKEVAITNAGNYSMPGDVFKYIESQEKIGGTWSKKEVEYDAKFGYPKRVNFDKANVTDEELVFQVLEFESLQ